MKVGVIQSNYVPWRGYFDLIDSVDLFVLYDDVGYSKNTYRNRNQLRFPEGLRWMTVPVNAHLNQPIDEVEIAGADWVVAHHGMLKESLGRAPYFKDALRVWEEGVADGRGRLSKLNARLIRGVCAYLGIGTRIVDSRPCGAVGAKTERLVDLLRRVGADAYISGPTGRGYIDEELFRGAGIRLDYKSYDYEPYPQQGEGFVGTVTVLDLIANCGPDSRRFLKSRTPDLTAVS